LELGSTAKAAARPPHSKVHCSGGNAENEFG
jgi:hypothetical protein